MTFRLEAAGRNTKEDLYAQARWLSSSAIHAWSRQFGDSHTGSGDPPIDRGQEIKNVEEGIHLKPGEKGYVEAAAKADVDSAMDRLRQQRKRLDPSVDARLLERMAAIATSQYLPLKRPYLLWK